MADPAKTAALTEREVACALGRLVRGIVHEAVGPLNGILMATELAEASRGDDAEVADCLETIASAARRSGEMLRDLGAVAAASEYAPTGQATLEGVVATARGLVGSGAVRSGSRVDYATAGGSAPCRINRMACAVAVALFVDALIHAGAKQLSVAALTGSVPAIRIGGDGATIDTDDVAWRFASRVCNDHGGALTARDSAGVILKFGA